MLFHCRFCLCRDSRHWLTDIKFSPDGKSFALASMDHKIYIYQADTFKLKGTCNRHNAAVTHVDFSVDGRYLQSDSTDYEHLYYEAEDGEYFSVPSQLRDLLWNDWTCTYGWPVQGIWPLLDEQGQSVVAEPSTCHRSPNSKLLAVGDQSGNVKLYNYPCLSKKVCDHLSFLLLALISPGCLAGGEYSMPWTCRRRIES